MYVWYYAGAGDAENAYLVGSYLHYAGFGSVEARDLSRRKKGGIIVSSNPLYIVTREKV